MLRKSREGTGAVVAHEVVVRSVWFGVGLDLLRRQTERCLSSIVEGKMRKRISFARGLWLHERLNNL